MYLQNTILFSEHSKHLGSGNGCGNI